MIVPNKRLMEERIHQDHETTFSHETRNTRQIEDFVVVPIPRQTHPPEHHLGSWLRVKNAQSPTFSTSTLLLTLETMEKEKKREKKKRESQGRKQETRVGDSSSRSRFLSIFPTIKWKNRNTEKFQVSRRRRRQSHRIRISEKSLNENDNEAGIKSKRK